MVDDNKKLYDFLCSLDCGGYPCHYAENQSGQRTQGGCMCLSELDTKTRMALKKWFNNERGKYYDAANNETATKILNTLVADDGKCSMKELIERRNRENNNT